MFGGRINFGVILFPQHFYSKSKAKKKKKKLSLMCKKMILIFGPN